MNKLALKLPHQQIIPHKICRFAQCAGARCGGILHYIRWSE